MAKDEVKDAAKEAAPFSEWLLTQANGRTHAELTEKWHDLLAAVRETGKKGSLQLAVTVTPAGKGDDRMVFITDNVTSKMPQGDRPQAVFFIDDDGNVTRSDPRQMRLDMKELEDADGKAPKELP